MQLNVGYKEMCLSMRDEKSLLDPMKHTWIERRRIKRILSCQRRSILFESKRQTQEPENLNGMKTRMFRDE
jgi:hypothetical protein